MYVCVSLSLPLILIYLVLLFAGNYSHGEGEDTYQHCCFWPWLTRGSPQQLAISLTNLVTMTCIIQAEDDHWAGDYGGPMFLLLGFVISVYVTEHCSTRDCWGLHIEITILCLDQF